MGDCITLSFGARWRPKFDPYDNSVGRLAIWARIPNLPIEYYERHFLWKVGSHIGKTLRVDPNTIREAIAEKENFQEDEVKRGRYARICVEIDFRKKLVSKIQIEEKLYAVEYEGLHSICFVCGKFGHKKDACPTLAKQTTQSGTLDVEDDWRNKVSVNFNSQAGERPNVGGETFGPWMIARRTPRRRSSMDAVKELQTPAPVTGSDKGRADLASRTKSHYSGKKINSGSRFSVFTDLVEDYDNLNTLEDAQVAHGNTEAVSGDIPRSSIEKRFTQSQKMKSVAKGVKVNDVQRNTLSSIQNRVIQKADKRVVGLGPGKENGGRQHLGIRVQLEKSKAGLQQEASRSMVGQSHMGCTVQSREGVGPSNAQGSSVLGSVKGPIPPDLIQNVGGSEMIEDHVVRPGDADVAMNDASGAVVVHASKC